MYGGKGGFGAKLKT